MTFSSIRYERYFSQYWPCDQLYTLGIMWRHLEDIQGHLEQWILNADEFCCSVICSIWIDEPIPIFGRGWLEYLPVRVVVVVTSWRIQPIALATPCITSIKKWIYILVRKVAILLGPFSLSTQNKSWICKCSVKFSRGMIKSSHSLLAFSAIHNLDVFTYCNGRIGNLLTGEGGLHGEFQSDKGTVKIL